MITQNSTNRNTTDVDVLIAGAGPVGLLLANLLGQRGLKVLVAERRMYPPEGSMAIGITPPSLSILNKLNLDQEFIKRGVPIDIARVFENGVCLGHVDFSSIPAEHCFILSLPQSETIKILSENLWNYPCVRFLAGADVVDYKQTENKVSIHLRNRMSASSSKVTASYLVGCDGHRSIVRRLAGIRSHGKSYPLCFLMADFEDDTDLGSEAHLYFSPQGSVESFPLPNGRRRWIVLAETDIAKETSIALGVIQRVRDRTQFDLSGARVRFEASFQPNRVLARNYVQDRVILCGDAAHVMSPIGGQGMNTGFADAEYLDCLLSHVLELPSKAETSFAQYTAVRKRAFQIAADRASYGMWLGTRTGRLFSIFRGIFIKHILFSPSVCERLATTFAMLTIPNVINQQDDRMATRKMT